MNPFQHGEVFVTDDGAETDLDIGHYERFLDVEPRRLGQRHHRPGLLDGHRQGAPRRVPRRHRPGHPAHHQRDQGAGCGRRPPRAEAPRTSSSPRSAAPSATSSRCRSSRPPARSARTSAADNVFFLHVSLVPYLAPSGELKTKPTQHSVAALRSIGIQPDAIVCRADREIPAGRQAQDRARCATSTIEAVVAAVDAPSIYDIPKVLHREGLDAYVVRRLGLPFRDVDWTELGRAAAPGAPPDAPGRGGPGRQVHRPAGRLPVGHRGAARRRLRRGRQGRTSAGSPRTPARPARAPGGCCRRGRGLRAGRVRRPRDRGQGRARCAGPGRTACRPSACAWACSAW